MRKRESMSDDKMRMGRREALFGIGTAAAGIGAATALAAVGVTGEVEAQVSGTQLLSGAELEIERERRREETRNWPGVQEIENCLYVESGFLTIVGFSDVPVGSKYRTWCGRELQKGSESEVDLIYVSAGVGLNPSLQRHSSHHTHAWKRNRRNENGGRIQADMEDYKTGTFETTDSRVCRACASAIVEALKKRVFIG